MPTSIKQFHENSVKPKISQNVENIYPLTATQNAFWVQSCLNPLSDPGVINVNFTITGSLDRETIKNAWRQTVMKFEMLRSTVRTSRQNHPLLVILKNVDVAVQFFDQAADNTTDAISAIEQITKATALSHSGSDPAFIPTLVCKLPIDGTMQFSWACHHLLLDGWSSMLVVQEFVSRCAELGEPNSASTPMYTTYAHYRKWLRERDAAVSINYWKDLLKDQHKPTIAFNASGRFATDTNRFHRTLLDSGNTQSLLILAQRESITPNSMIQTLWGLILQHLTSLDSVVFGVATSGRPASIDGIENSVGMFSNVVPCKVKTDGKTTFADICRHVHTVQLNSLQHDYLPLPDILDTAEPACRTQCFDSLLVFENLPTDKLCNNLKIQLSDYHSDIVSAYPLTITIVPADEWKLHIHAHSVSVDNQWVDTLQIAMSNALKAIITNPSISCQSIRQVHFKELLTTRQQLISTSINNTRKQPRIEWLLNNLVPPVNVTEMDMLNLWEETLQQRPISMCSDFFELGGSSLTFLRLISSIETEFGTRIPVASLMRQPTPQQATKLLATDNTSKLGIPCLVLLKKPFQSGPDAESPRYSGKSTETLNTEHNARIPLFCIHAAGGHAMFYRQFAQKLHPLQPVYALQPRGVDGFEEPISSIRQMAAHYIDEILSVYPEGPHHLMCYCFGGGLILEMVQQLEAKNIPIGKLIIVDALAPIPVSHPMSRFGWHAYLLFEQLVFKNFDFIWNSAKGVLKQFVQEPFGRLSPKHLNDADEAQAPSHLLKVQNSCEQAFRSYRATPTSRTIHILQGYEPNSSSRIAHYMRAWQTLAPHRVSYQMVANHTRLFVEPELTDTSDCISEILNTDLLNNNNQQTLASSTASEC